MTWVRLLTVAAARLCGYSAGDDRHIKLATCVEFIHSATLLHDDVVDVSALRRGKPSANAVWGDKASVLVGDFLFTRAFERWSGMPPSHWRRRAARAEFESVGMQA